MSSLQISSTDVVKASAVPNPSMEPIPCFLAFELPNPSRLHVDVLLCIVYFPIPGQAGKDFRLHTLSPLHLIYVSMQSVWKEQRSQL
jgi:hypothetical protein